MNRGGLKKTERRLNQRSPLTEKVTFEISTHLTPHGFKENQTTAERDSYIKNVSEGGICLMTKESLATAQVIKISLPLPHLKIAAPTLAEVRWVRKDPAKDLFHAGLRFLL